MKKLGEIPVKPLEKIPGGTPGRTAESSLGEIPKNSLKEPATTPKITLRETTIDILGYTLMKIL